MTTIAAVPPRFAIVDVETTGFHRQLDRIVQVAVLQLDEHCAPESRWTSLVDPGRDPGPTHIHGVSAAMLAGQPAFHDIAPQLGELVAGRVVVAHNAIFDWEFLQSEYGRTTAALDVTHRLCTLAMARRLDLTLPDLKLPTLARWAGARQTSWHNAVDDVDTLSVIFRRLMELCARSGLPLPYARNHPQLGATIPEVSAPKVASPWRPVTEWVPGTRLQQGAKFAITGGTTAPREQLYDRAIAAGLIPMNSVSRRTAVVVCNAEQWETRKLRSALDAGVPVITERTFEALLTDLEPGVPVGPATERSKQPTMPPGPLTGMRVLVLGGPHDVAAGVREQITALGGRVAVNCTPSVTHVVALEGAAADRRWERASLLPRLAPDSWGEGEMLGAAVQDIEPSLDVPGTATSVTSGVVLRRGVPIDLPRDITSWEVFTSWSLADPSLEVDVVALVVDGDERVLSDDHLVYFNALSTPEGSVRLNLDTLGEAELAVDLDELPGPGVKVVLAAVVSGEATFGDVGPLEVVIRDGHGAEAARATLDAGTVERSMLVAEFYRRGENWRVKPIGQGYEDDLRAFVERHGVVVDD